MKVWQPQIRHGLREFHFVFYYPGPGITPVWVTAATTTEAIRLAKAGKLPNKPNKMTMHDFGNNLRAEWVL